MRDILIFLVEWLPLLVLIVLIGLLLFIMMRTGVPKDYAAMASAQLEEARRQTQILDRIATALEKATKT